MRKKLFCSLITLFILFAPSCQLKPESIIDRSTKTPLEIGESTAVISSPTIELPPDDHVSITNLSNDIFELLSTLRIVYTDDEKLWIWENGESRLLTESLEYANPFETDHVVISGDGNLIAFGTGYWGDQVHVINVDGSDERVVVDRYFTSDYDESPMTILYKLGWIPETHKLIIDTSLWIQTGLYSPGKTNIIFDADDSSIQINNSSDLYFPSPNGRLIAAVNSEVITVMNSYGSDRRTIFTFNSPLPGGWSYPTPMWGNDSNSIALSIPASDVQSSSFWKIILDPLDVSLLAEIDNWPETYSPGSISPDFSYLIYSKESDLFFRNLSLSDDRLLYSGDVLGEVKWAPDANKFIFLTTVDADNVMMGSISDGGELETLKGLHVSEVDWIDSDNVLFFGSHEIGIWNVDEGVSIHLADIDGWYPLFSKYDFYVE
jgi:hypothetical protein